MPTPRRPAIMSRRSATQLDGLKLLGATVGLMWVLEVINTIDANHLDGDGIHPRSLDRLWGILTSPFIHASFQHLIDNTIPFVFMGAFIALQGARRLFRVTLLVIVLGGLGTWLISPSHDGTGHSIVTIGASGVVFGYATYLFARGVFNRRLLELLVGLVVGGVWGAALLSSLVPHQGVSWQAHLCGAIAGVVAAWALSDRRERARGGGSPAATAAPAR